MTMTKTFMRTLLIGLISLGILTLSASPSIALSDSPQLSPRVLEEVADRIDEGFETYSSSELKKLNKAANTVYSMRSDMERVQPKIQLRNWTDVHDDVAVLLPELRQSMYAVTQQLKLSDRALARAVSTEVLIHLERVDEADEMNNYQAAQINYMQALQDFDIFLTLIPTV